MKEKYYEDYHVGQIFKTGSIFVDAASIKEFAGQFDPQPQHLDEIAAQKTIFRGLVASGWHTASLTMRLFIESEFTSASGIIGAGFDELSWPNPLRPGDTIHVVIDIIKARLSQSRSTHGLLKVRMITYNQNDQIVQREIVNLLVPRNPLNLS